MPPLGAEMLAALNKQLNREVGAAHLYFAMGAHFDYKNWCGFAKFFRKHATEELSHADKFYAYINDRGAKVELEALPKPKAEWENAVDALKDALTHEEFITSEIWKLMELAQEKKDHATQSFLKYFVDEQVEEEALVDGILQKALLLKEPSVMMHVLDRELEKHN